MTKALIAFAGSLLCFSLQNANAQANTSLSNLSSVAVNSAMLPDSTDNYRMLGDSSHIWNVMWARQTNVFMYNLRTSETGSTIQTIWRADGATSPGGNSVGTYMEHYGTSSMGFWTWNEGTNNSSPSGSIIMETGDKIAGTGNSGNIILGIGTSLAGSRGKIKFVDGSHGTAGHVWTSTGTDGSGHWEATKSPAGTICGWSDGTLTLNCQGLNPSSSCPSGYTQRTNAASAVFCSAN